MNDLEIQNRRLWSFFATLWYNADKIVIEITGDRPRQSASHGQWSGVALAMRHGLSGLCTHELKGQRKGDEHPAYALLG